MRKLGSLLLVLVLVLLSVIPAFAQERPSVLEILENDADERFTTLLAAIDAAGLREALEGEGPFTVLAPTNDAFAAALQAMGGVTPEQALALGEGLQPILLKHVIGGQYFFRNLTGGPTLETLSGESVTFNLTDGVFTVNGIGIADPDQLGSNGIVHAIDGVILPDAMSGAPAAEPAPEETPAPVAVAPTRPNLAELLAADADGRFTTLLAAVEAAGLGDALSAEGDLTILAPTNDAFAAALDYLGVSAEDLLEDTETLTAVLTYHVLPGRYFLRNLTSGPEVATLQGDTVQFNLTDGRFTVNGNRISDPDQLGSNGIFHAIDGVLLPPALAEAAAANRANVRFVHLSPDFGAADIYADDALVGEGVTYGAATEWTEVAAGAFKVGVAATGEEPGGNVISSIAPGSWTTIAVIGVAANDTVSVEFLTEDYSAPADGRARVSVLHAIPNLGTVDILVNGQLFIGALAYPGAAGENDGLDSRDVLAGSYGISINQAGTANELVDAGNFRFEAGGNYLIAAAGAPNSPAVFVYTTPAAAE